MDIELLDFSENPQDVVDKPYDCIWVAFKHRDKPTPSPSKTVQWLDWKLQGRLSRYLLQGSESGVTFFPTTKRIPSKMVALSGGSEWDWDAFRRNCEGMKLETILVFCEDPAQVTEHQQKMKALKQATYPQQVSLATEKQVRFES